MTDNSRLKYRAFACYSPQQSFSSSGKGYPHQSLCDTSETLVMDWATWSIGKQAYDIFCKYLGEEATDKNIIDVYIELDDFLDSIADPIDQQYRNGVIEVADIGNIDDFKEYYLNASIDWKLKLLELLLDLNEHAPSDEIIDLPVAHAVCCLFAIDEAVAVDFPNKGEPGNEIMRAKDSLNLATRRIDISQEVRRQLSSRGREGGIARQSGNAKLKGFALNLFHTGKFKSTLQAAKIIYPEVQSYAEKKGITLLSTERGEKTVYEWLLSDKNCGAE